MQRCYQRVLRALSAIEQLRVLLSNSKLVLLIDTGVGLNNCNHELVLNVTQNLYHDDFCLKNLITTIVHELTRQYYNIFKLLR